MAGASAHHGPAFGTDNGEWPVYTGDLKGTRYSPLDQVKASNFNQLEIAWRFKTDNLGGQREFKLEGTPLMVDGVIYTTAGTRRAAIALDARTGELIWMYSLREGERGSFAPRSLSGRGVSYWTDGKGDDRVLYVTPGYRLIALNAHTGVPVKAFGRGGILDLKEGVVVGRDQQIDLVSGEIGLHATPTVAKDVVIVGSAFREGMVVKTHNNTKGLVRAFDVRSGKRLWTFNTIPKPGEFGNDSWLNDSWAVNGNTGAWTQITVDEELGLVYLPVESPTSDFYGGMRPGNNLFAESLVCVDLKTGRRKWHFQFVHHPLWDHDLAAPPILADIKVDGKTIKAVAVPGKQALLFVFDRVTGQPVWPIVETPLPQGDVPGEWYSPTQPIPTKPPMYGRSKLRVPDDLIDFTPEMRAQALKVLDKYKWEEGTLYNPAIVGRVDGLLGAINLGNVGGGTNWPGGGYDPQTHILYVHAITSGIQGISVAPPPPGYSDVPYLVGTVGREFRMTEPGGGSTPNGTRQPPAAPVEPPRVGMNVQGLPILKPPYGVLAAINLDSGEIAWRVAHGDTPDQIRNHPALAGMDIPRTGQGAMAGLVITKTLVIIGDPQVTTTPDHPRGAMLRAYDKGTGEQVGAVWMPAAQSGSPMTYMLDGKQYIVVAVSGNDYSGEYLAFRLPDTQ